MRVLEGPICLTALGVALLWLRFALMGNSPPEFAPADNPAAVSESRLTRFLTFSYLPAFNIWLLLCPSQLSFDWSMDAIPLIETISDFRNFFTLVFYLFLVTAAWTMSNNLWLEPGAIVSAVSSEVVCANGHAASNGHASLNSASLSHKTCIENIRIRTVTFAFALLVLPFVPATNLFFYVGFVVAERILYISSFGYCLLISEAVCFLWHGYCAQKSHRRAYLKFAVAMLLILLSARTFRRNFDWLTEERLYRSGSGTNPAKALGNLANILKAQGKFQEAEIAYRQALNHRGNMADVHYNLGVLLQDQKRYSEAVESYKSAIQFRARMTMAYLNLGIVYTALGMKAEAEKIYIQCAFIDYSGFKDPRSHEQTQISALYNLGRLYADQGKYKEAVEAYSLAVERRPPYYPPQSLYNMLGEAYMKLNLLDKAEHWYRESLNVKSDHMPAHLTMGKLYHAKGQLKMAEEWFVKALQLVPDDTSALSHFGQFLAETGRHNEAAEQYLKASVLTPDDFDIIFNTANALREAKRNIEAEQFYRRSAALKPNDATAHMNLGAILHLNGKLAEAERSYLTSLKLKPNDLTTTENLKKLRAIKGNEQLKLRV